jgi:hypothetical protein
MDLGLSALGRGHATISRPVARLRPSAAILSFSLSALCWCSFAGTLPPRCGLPARPRSGVVVGETRCGPVSCEGVEDRSVVWLIQVSVCMVVLLFREVVGWSSGFRAVMHQRRVCLLAWTTPPPCAEPMCEAKRTHHPSLGLEESVGPDGLRFKLFIYEYSVFGIWTEQADGDNRKSLVSLSAGGHRRQRAVSQSESRNNHSNHLINIMSPSTDENGRIGEWRR